MTPKEQVQYLENKDLYLETNVEHLHFFLSSSIL